MLFESLYTQEMIICQFSWMYYYNHRSFVCWIIHFRLSSIWGGQGFLNFTSERISPKANEFYFNFEHFWKNRSLSHQNHRIPTMKFKPLFWIRISDCVSIHESRDQSMSNRANQPIRHRDKKYLLVDRNIFQTWRTSPSRKWLVSTLRVVVGVALSRF